MSVVAIVLSGSIPAIRQKLLAMKAAIANRQITGWPVLLPDESWRYITAHDERVCKEICDPLDNKRFPGDVVAATFENGQARNARTIKTNTHEPRDPNCRCAVYWENAPEAVTARLRAELEEINENVS